MGTVKRLKGKGDTTNQDGSDVQRWSCGRCSSFWDAPADLPQQERARLKKQVYAPCWSCGLRRGCPSCAPQMPVVCSACGVYTTRETFTLEGERLPQSDFDRYPASWRFTYWAVFGIPAEMRTYVMNELANPARAAFVERMRGVLHLDQLEGPA